MNHNQVEHRQQVREAREVAETMFHLDDLQRPEAEALRLFESNPDCSIGMFWSMSGYGFAPADSEELNNPDVDSAKFRTAKADVEEYLDKIKITEEEVNNCIKKFNAEMDPSQPLLTCAACGITDLDLAIKTRSIDTLEVLKVSHERLQCIEACEERFRTVYTVWCPPDALHTRQTDRPRQRDRDRDRNSETERQKLDLLIPMEILKVSPERRLQRIQSS